MNRFEETGPRQSAPYSEPFPDFRELTTQRRGRLIQSLRALDGKMQVHGERPAAGRRLARGSHTTGRNAGWGVFEAARVVGDGRYGEIGH
jgi:hypothetical protein